MALSKLLAGLCTVYLLAACASGGGDAGQRRGFSELGLGRVRPGPVRATQPRLDEAPAPASSAVSPLQPVEVDDARRKVDAFLRARGFEPQDERSGGGDRIVATRMTTDVLPPEVADCALHALSRPQMYATTVNVRLTPGDVGVDARFTVMDIGVISGALTKHVCRTRGVLEAAVRRAALTGRLGG